MSANTITVYGKPNCFGCKKTQELLDNAGIDFAVVDLTEDEAAYAMVTALGYKQAPIVITDNDQWSGLRPDKISELING